jgi:hypothetical protein
LIPKQLDRTVLIFTMSEPSNEKLPSTVLPDEVTEGEKTSDAASIHVAEAQGFGAKETKRLLRKLDWHLIPFMSLIYL